MKTTGKPSICFVAPDSFPALMDDPTYGHIGGAETQQVLLGRSLAKRGYGVYFITLDHGQNHEMDIDGMRIIKTYDPKVGIRMLRFLHPRVTSLWRAMKEANADIYYQRTQDSTTGIMVTFCRWHKRKSVFAAASELDCMPLSPLLQERHARMLYHYGLRRADRVIAQTERQQKLFDGNFGICSTIVPNCAPDYGFEYDNGGRRISSGQNRLLWIGGFLPVKRLEVLLDVAELFKEAQFDVVGDGDVGSDYVQSLKRRAHSIPNVHLHGKVPHGQIHQFYRQADALICTSHTEGFPNTFLEAWSHGLPVVSTVDPDDVIANKRIGIVAQDLKELVSGTQRLLRDEDLWQRISYASRQHYLRKHTVKSVMPRLEAIFCSLMNMKTISADGYDE